jgi:hypothetical protein
MSDLMTEYVTFLVIVSNTDTNSNKFATFQLDLALYCLMIALGRFCPVTVQRLGCPRRDTRLRGRARQA